MARIYLTGTLEYDNDTIHGKDPVDIEWFQSDILLGQSLSLHSDEIGDTVGVFYVDSIKELPDKTSAQ